MVKAINPDMDTTANRVQSTSGLIAKTKNFYNTGEYFIMRIGFSQQEIIGTAKSLGLPTDGFIQRRVARAQDLVASNKVSRMDDGIFRVSSQYDVAKSYIVNLNGDWGCDCPDHQKHTGDSCKHMIASMIFAQKHEAKSLIIKDVTEYKKNVRRAWFIIDGKRRINLWQDLNGKLCCNCGAYYDGDCKHKKVIREYLNNDGGNGSKITNECGSEKAKAIQEKLNGQLNSRQDNGNGATGGFVTADNHQQAPSQLDITDPFQQSEQLDIDQIESAEG
ncbi:MAG: SWIM zinc finger family protein, partial [Deltaproteobacteria bacterium]|nr:SWIM zinc finger family protein [Deltaproteobacteria bacterium]